MSRIVLIDDEELVRESVAKLLELRGHETLSFESAEAFFEASGFQDAECLLVDFRLPGMNGCELLRKLRTQSINTPAVLLSGNIDETIESMLHGLRGILTLGKPCLSADLYSAVEKAMDAQK